MSEPTPAIQAGEGSVVTNCIINNRCVCCDAQRERDEAVALLRDWLKYGRPPYAGNPAWQPYQGTDEFLQRIDGEGERGEATDDSPDSI